MGFPLNLALGEGIRSMVTEDSDLKIKIGEWGNPQGERGDISMITNARAIGKKVGAVKGIVENRFVNGDDGEHRYGPEGGKAIIG